MPSQLWRALWASASTLIMLVLVQSAVSAAASLGARTYAVGHSEGLAEATVMPLGVPGNWRLRFDAVFTGVGLDRTTWQPNWLGEAASDVTPAPNSSDLSCAAPSQVAVAGGLLELAAVRRRCTADNGTRYRYASGVVTTVDSFRFTYGYVEARVDLPAQGGTPVNFPAVWADGTGHWPSTGELDVLEVLHSCGPGLSYHFHSDLGSSGGCVRLPRAAGWHTVGADWQHGAVTYYYDGHEVGKISSGITGRPMFLILDNSVNPGTGGPVSVPSVLKIAYVRVWESPVGYR